MVKNKLRELISKLVREEMMGESTIVDPGTSSGEAAKIAKGAGVKIGTVTTAIDQAKKSGEPSTVAEMARASEVFYTLKSDFKDDLQNVQSKLSKSEFRSLVDIVKVLKDANAALTANDILKKHNEQNPDRQYASQQSFIRPLVIGAIGKKKIGYDDLPFKASQKDVSTSFEKATNAATPSQSRGEKFGRDVEYEPKSLSNPDFKMASNQASVANSMLDYKRAREAYRKAEKPEEKQKYLDKLQSIANNPEMGKEIAQQYMDGYIATQDPATLSAYKKYKDEIQREADKRKNKPKYKVPSFSTRNQDVTIDNPEETEED
jgi:hypothetical protein